MKMALRLTLIITGILPALYTSLIAIMSLWYILGDFQIDQIPLLIASIFALLGFVGFILLLPKSRTNKESQLTRLFLIFGFLSLLIFVSFNGGWDAWRELLTFQKPMEVLIFVYPSLIALVFAIKGANFLK